MKLLSFLIKTFLAAGLFSYLFIRASKGAAFDELQTGKISPNFLLAGFFFNFTATCVTIIRWRALVQALDAPLSLSNALRFGFIGFMFNLSPIGIAGGDAVKVYLLNHKTKTPLDKATASVLMDRVVGLYAMFILGIIAVFFTGFYRRSEPLARFTTQGLIALTLAATVFLAFVLTPESQKNRRHKLAKNIPLIGGFLNKLINATLIYRRRKKILFWSFIATFVVHLNFAVSLFCIAYGLFHESPTLSEHIILYCSGNVGSIIPLSAGPFEYFLDELYPLFPIHGEEAFQHGYGMIIGVVYRLATVGVALIGVIYYLISRADVKEALNDSVRQ